MNSVVFIILLVIMCCMIGCIVWLFIKLAKTERQISLVLKKTTEIRLESYSAVVQDLSERIDKQQLILRDNLKTFKSIQDQWKILREDYSTDPHELAKIISDHLKG